MFWLQGGAEQGNNIISFILYKEQIKHFKTQYSQQKCTIVQPKHTYMPEFDFKL